MYCWLLVVCCWISWYTFWQPFWTLPQELHAVWTSFVWRYRITPESKKDLLDMAGKTRRTATLKEKGSFWHKRSTSICWCLLVSGRGGVFFGFHVFGRGFALRRNWRTPPWLARRWGSHGQRVLPIINIIYIYILYVTMHILFERNIFILYIFICLSTYLSRIYFFNLFYCLFEPFFVPAILYHLWMNKN